MNFHIACCIPGRRRARACRRCVYRMCLWSRLQCSGDETYSAIYTYTSFVVDPVSVCFFFLFASSITAWHLHSVLFVFNTFIDSFCYRIFIIHEKILFCAWIICLRIFNVPPPKLMALPINERHKSRPKAHIAYSRPWFVYRFSASVRCIWCAIGGRFYRYLGLKMEFSVVVIIVIVDIRPPVIRKFCKSKQKHRGLDKMHASIMRQC